MKISYNWVREYLNVDLDVNRVSEILTDTGLEVEGIESFESIKGGLKGIIVGEVLTCEKHPNADKLSITTVNIGTDDVLPIVCGAPNVAAGQKVLVATDGTILYDGNESFTIKKSKIRGEASIGMICAEDELGLGTDHDGIMVLPENSVAGTPASEIFPVETDTVFEIGLTPNRIDGASHYGVARDLAAYLNQTGEYDLLLPSVDEFKVDNTTKTVPVIVEDAELCPRYSGVTISGVKVAPSPQWLQNRLKAIGLSPINNIVDITNYVLQETGHPLHAFDLAQVSGDKVIVKTLAENTPFVTLDGTERKLSNQDLMICNDKEGMCIAGVFGGEKSGVSDSTTDIFLESAYFNPVSIRKSARRHTLNTDASFRFERGADANNTVYALKRAAVLIQEIAGGEISSEIQDFYPKTIEKCVIEVSYAHIDRLIGKSIEHDKIKSILTSLDIVIDKEDEAGLTLSIPTYRVDVTREADVIEEILRIYGFNNVEAPGQVRSTLTYVNKPDKFEVERMIAQLLAGNGYSEIMCNSLTKASYFENEPFVAENTVTMLNPLSQDLNGLRQTLMFGALESVAYNVNRQSADLKFFEFGNTYQVDMNKEVENPRDKYSQESCLSITITGKDNPHNWSVKQNNTNFFNIKSTVDGVLSRLGYDLRKFKKTDSEKGVFSDSMCYSLNGKNIVDFGQVKTSMTKLADVKIPVYFAEFHWDVVLKQIKKHKVTYTDIAKYPEVKRDLALLIDSSVTYQQIEDIAYKVEKRLLKDVNLFDVFEDKKLGDDKKSYAVSFTLQDENKTLTDKQIDKIMKKMISTYERELGASIR